MSVRAQDQLERLLLALPHLEENTALAFSELARRVGTTERTLLADLHALGDRDRDVAGFNESIELHLGPDGVGARTDFFKRPMRLTRPELAALDLGLGMLLLERSLEERGTIEQARTKLRRATVPPPKSVVAGVPTVTTLDPPNAVAAEAAPSALVEYFGVLWQARDEQRSVRIGYRSADAEAAEERTVHPWAVVRAHQHLYVVGWCTSVTDVRVFRLDRIVSVAFDGTRFDVPADFDINSVVRDGRVFSGELPDDELVVRFSPRIARWIAERERLSIAPDGSVTVHWPLADDEWAVRHVLQYGSDAQVVAPARIRQAIMDRLVTIGSPAGIP